MAEPVRNPETGGRSLADILREAGIENPSRGGRKRRWDDVDDTGIRQRDADGSERPPDRGGYGRRAGDVPLDRPAPVRDAGARDAGARDDDPRDRRRRRDDRALPEQRPAARDDRARRDEQAPREDRAPRDERREGRPRAGRAGRVPPPEHSTAAIPGLRPSRTPSVPGATPAAASVVETPARERRADEGRTDERPSDERPTGKRAADERRTDKQRTGGTDRRGTPGQRGADERRTGGRRLTDRRADAAPATGPIPAIHPDDVLAHDLDAGPKDSALAWLRFAGELVIAAAGGVGIYFAFTVLWQTLPHLAVLAAPLAVTGLVAGVTVWRQRLGHAQLGARLLAVLVFAGTLLTVLPAAGLITGN